MALKWESAQVVQVLDTEHVLLQDDRVIKIIGFDGPDIYFPSLQERPTARRTFQFLKHILLNESVKVLKDDISCSLKQCKSHLKLSSGELVAEKLLSMGLGKFIRDPASPRFDKKFIAAESLAKESKIGQWDISPWNKSAEIIRNTAGVATMSWRKKFGQYLAPISIGRVYSIESGNTFHLQSGLCVKLLGVESPIPQDSRRGHSCFGKKAKAYLESLILNNKVELKKDISQLDDEKCLLRHVWLPGKFGQLNGDIHVNKLMITDGYGRANIPQGNKQFLKVFPKLQKEVYENPRGAWLKCAREIISKKTEKKKVKKANDDCPIKVSSTGKYHTPASSWYGRLNPEQCFDSEEDAIDAGYKKAN